MYQILIEPKEVIQMMIYGIKYEKKEKKKNPKRIAYWIPCNCIKANTLNL